MLFSSPSLSSLRSARTCRRMGAPCGRLHGSGASSAQGERTDCLVGGQRRGAGGPDRRLCFQVTSVTQVGAGAYRPRIWLPRSRNESGEISEILSEGAIAPGQGSCLHVQQVSGRVPFAGLRGVAAPDETLRRPPPPALLPRRRITLARFSRNRRSGHGLAPRLAFSVTPPARVARLCKPGGQPARGPSGGRSRAQEAPRTGRVSRAGCDRWIRCPDLLVGLRGRMARFAGVAGTQRRAPGIPWPPRALCRPGRASAVAFVCCLCSQRVIVRRRTE